MSRDIVPERVLGLLRLPTVALTLLFIIYCNVYMWFYVPSDDFEFTWSPDTQLFVVDLTESALAAPHLREKDEILAVDEQAVRRMTTFYPLPLKSTYTFTIRRGEDILTEVVPVPTRLTMLAVKNQLPTTILSIVGWAVGALILLIARPSNSEAVRAGYIFLLAPVVLVGIQAAQDGAPLAWLGGHVLLFYLPVAWIYLGFIPRFRPLPRPVKALFAFLLTAATLFALAAMYEALFLFPDGVGFEVMAGVSLYTVGFLLSGAGMITFVLTLALRAVATQADTYLRQQLSILLVFVAAGALPIVILTILPNIFFGVILLPFPLAISLMLLIPAGYLFVIHRNGFLGLDPIFSRGLFVVLFSLVIFGFYVAGLYAVQRLLRLDGAEAVLPATIVFFPTLLLAVYVNRPIYSFVQQLVYGDAPLNQDTLANFTASLAAQPEAHTINEVITALAKLLDVTHASFVVSNGSGRTTHVASVGLDEIEPISTNMITNIRRPLLRATVGELDDPFNCFAWAEILVPVVIRGEPMGVLALSRPGRDGYFNAREVAFLSQAAGVLAVASENIYLFEATRNLSMQALAIREEERRQLSLQIHDTPLQQVTFVAHTVDRLLAKLSDGGQLLVDEEVRAALEKTGQHVRMAADALRSICFGLYPPFRDQGARATVEETVHHFEQVHELRIELTFTGCALTTEPVGTERVTTAVSHVLGEALNNVVKHVPDAQVRVNLHCERERLMLTVTDNGSGCAIPNLSFSELVRRGHLGIVGMHEWARYAGGRLQIEENNPKGLSLSLLVPCALVDRM